MAHHGLVHSLSSTRTGASGVSCRFDDARRLLLAGPVVSRDTGASTRLGTAKLRGHAHDGCLGGATAAFARLQPQDAVYYPPPISPA